MKKLLQINSVVNTGSTGVIVEEIGRKVMSKGWESFIAYGRNNATNSKSNLIKVGNNYDILLHGISTRLFDNHGLCSKRATENLVGKIKEISPDVIHLHNVHGYYINYPILFSYLREWSGPVVWTLHDCWAFTGHCAYYSFAKCDKWKFKCNNCPQKKQYPSSLLFDRSEENFQKKGEIFGMLPNLTIVTVSDWLSSQVRMSFLGKYRRAVIKNGINRDIFNVSYKELETKKNPDVFRILGVANTWDRRKGLMDFIELRKKLPNNFEITLVGLSQKQIEKLPSGIVGISRTSTQSELAKLYANSDVYINTSIEETLGMTTIEAMGCGTPAIVYESTACSEPIEPVFCKSVPPRNIDAVIKAINEVIESQSPDMANTLSRWVDNHFTNEVFLNNYMSLYDSLTSENA